MPWEAGPIWNSGACEGELHWMIHTHHAQLARVRAHLDACSMHQQQLIRDDTNNTKAHNASVHLAGISLKTQELYVLVFCARYPRPPLELLLTIPTTHYPLSTIHYPLPTTHYPLLTTVGTSTSSGTTSRTTTSA